MDIDIDIQTAEGVLEGKGIQTPICCVSRSGCFLLIPRHESKVGMVFKWSIVIFLFSFIKFYYIPSI